jgi:hypothetical protein
MLTKYLDQVIQLDLLTPDRGIGVHSQAGHSPSDHGDAADDHSRSLDLSQGCGEGSEGLQKPPVFGLHHGLPK